MNSNVDIAEAHPVSLNIFPRSNSQCATNYSGDLEDIVI